jgi:hypothetical protein
MNIYQILIFTSILTLIKGEISFNATETHTFVFEKTGDGYKNAIAYNESLTINNFC